MVMVLNPPNVTSFRGSLLVADSSKSRDWRVGLSSDELRFENVGQNTYLSANWTCREPLTVDVDHAERRRAERGARSPRTARG